MPYRDLATKRAHDRARRRANPARTRANAHAWYAANADRARADSRAWHAANLDRAHASARTRYAANPEPARMLARHAKARRRARLAQALATLTAEQWQAILELAGGQCIYCGAATNLSMDHLTPLSRGGNHTAENVAPACLPCNLSKGAKVVMEFLAEKET